MGVGWGQGYSCGCRHHCLVLGGTLVFVCTYCSSCNFALRLCVCAYVLQHLQLCSSRAVVRTCYVVYSTCYVLHQLASLVQD